MKRLQGISLALLGIAILIPHLVEIGYHPFAFETLTIGTVSALVLFLFGYFTGRVGYTVLVAILIYWLGDSFFLGQKNANILALLVIFGAIVSKYLSQTVIPLATIAFSIIFFAPSLLTFPDPILSVTQHAQTENGEREKPEVAFLHLILDEQMSPHAVSSVIDERPFKDTFVSDYVDAGFHVEELALSSSPNTYRSLGRIFGLQAGIENSTYKKRHKYSYILNENRLMPALYRLGFDISVIESNFLELCIHVPTIACETYTRAANMNVTEGLGSQYGKRLKFALLALHQDYFFAAHKVEGYRSVYKQINRWRKGEKLQSFGFFSRPLANMQILDEVAARTADLKAGDALIAHVLLPHFPYVLNTDCSLKDINEWTYPIRHDIEGDQTGTYKGFWDQSECTHLHMQKLFKIIAERDDLVVIVHGDHGARIMRDTALENELDSLGTFLAIKGPKITPGSSKEPIPLQQAFIDLFNTHVRGQN